MDIGGILMHTRKKRINKAAALGQFFRQLCNKRGLAVAALAGDNICLAAAVEPTANIRHFFLSAAEHGVAACDITFLKRLELLYPVIRLFRMSEIFVDKLFQLVDRLCAKPVEPDYAPVFFRPLCGIIKRSIGKSVADMFF